MAQIIDTAWQRLVDQVFATVSEAMNTETAVMKVRSPGSVIVVAGTRQMWDAFFHAMPNGIARDEIHITTATRPQEYIVSKTSDCPYAQ